MHAERMTPDSIRILNMAIDAAEALEHNYRGTGHVLSAMLRFENPARQILNRLGVNDLQTLSQRILTITPRAATREDSQGVLFITEHLRRAIELAEQAALQYGAQEISPEYLLLGLVSLHHPNHGEHNTATQVLESYGYTRGALESYIRGQVQIGSQSQNPS